ncbi:MAG: PD-(D/E)XK nuclease family protein [Acidimicrobiales bacterium]
MTITGATATTTTTHEGDDSVLLATEDLLDRSLPRPIAREELVGELRQVLEEGLADLAGREKPLWISKARLGEANQCESFAAARRAERFSWSEPAALGTLADRAIAVGLAQRLSPEACVESALAATKREGKDLARFLDALGPATKELLVVNAAELVGGLLDCWPCFSPDNFESQVAMRARLASGAVVLSGTPDLVLGSLHAPDGRSRALVLDWKSGQLRPEHALEHRFYALLTTLQARRPPWRVATYYLARQRSLVDDVSEELLFEVAARVIEVAHALDDIAASRRPTRYRPGECCAWCPISSVCPERYGSLLAERQSKASRHRDLPQRQMVPVARPCQVPHEKAMATRPERWADDPGRSTVTRSDRRGASRRGQRPRRANGDLHWRSGALSSR